MPIINKTPHVLNVHLAGGGVREFTPTLPAARCAVSRVASGEIDGIEVDQVSFGEVQDLPPPEENVFLVVSALVASAAKHRTDLLVVGEAVRDGNGRVVGCKGLSRP